MRQGVCDVHFCASPIVTVVFQYEVYHPLAVGLEFAILVAYQWVYLAPCLLCFVCVVVGALLDEDVWRPVLWGTLPVRNGFSRLGECRDGGRQCGFSDLGYHAGVCGEVPVYCARSRLVGVVGVRKRQRVCLFDLGYCIWVYGGRVVLKGVLGGVPVCTGGTSRGLHGLRCEGVVEGDIFEAVDFRGPPCPPVRQREVAPGTVQGIVDSCPLQFRVNGNVVDCCRVYPDSLCGSRLGRLVVSQGCAFNGGRALGGYEKVHGLC